MLYIFCIHDVVQDQVCSPWEIQAIELETLLATLLDRGYQFCTLDDLANLRNGAVAVTFDDAPGGAVDWILQRAHAFGLTATVFPVVNWLDRPPARSPEHAYRSLANWQEIEHIRHNGHIIGSHGMSHVPMHMLTKDRLIYELKESKLRLESVCESSIHHFAAPFGKLSSDVVANALSIGYATISSTIPGVNTEKDLRGGVMKRYVVRSDLPGLGLADFWSKR